MKNKLLKNTVFSFIRLITLLIAVCILSFSLISASPIDPVQAYVGAGVAVSPEQRENISEYWGIDKPFGERFLSWGSAIIKGRSEERRVGKNIKKTWWP